MLIAEHVDALRRDGGTFASVLADADLDAPVPCCPEWRVRDLARHLGGVHRWATTFVATARATVSKDDGDLEHLAGGWPPDSDTADWFRSGHGALVAALESAPEDLACWTFLPAPSPLAFWARRQAHETAIHLTDARGALGATSVFAPAFSGDGLDELLLGFGGRRRGGTRTTIERTLMLSALDLDTTWHVRLTPGDPGDIVVAHDSGDAECTVTAAASDLYLLLWNRRGIDGLMVEGDDGVLDLWRQQVRITWS